MNTGTGKRARIAFAASLAAVALAGVAWWAVAAARSTLYEIHSREPVSGLIPGAPVEFHGVEVGKVQEVRLADARNVRVLLDLRSDAPVTTATVATITGRGLAARGFTGYVYVSLEDRAGAGQPLRPVPGARHPVIASAPGSSVSLDQAMTELNRNVQVVTGLLQGVLDAETTASLKRSVAGLEQLTHTLAANNQRVEAILANAERATARMQPLLQASDRMLHTLNGGILPQAQHALVGLEDLSTSTRQRIGVVLDNTERASTRLGPLLQSGGDAVQSLQTQVLPQAHRTLAHMENLSTTLDETAMRIRRNPAVLLRGASPPPAGPGEAP